MADLTALDGLVEVVGPIRPGDSLVLRLSATSREQFDELVDIVGKALEERLPGVKVAFVAGAEQILVYRPSTD